MNTFNEQPRRVTDTNSGVDFSGSVFGIALPLFRQVVISLAGSFLLFLALQSWLELSTARTFLIAFAPTGIIALVLFFFFQGKPPGHLRDLIDSALTGGDASPLQKRRKP